MTFPDLYEQALVGPLFRPFAQLMLEKVAPAPGESVLDIACGTGVVARVARERVGERATVVGVDISAPMLAVARRVAPQIDWREGDAGALPLLEDERFELVVCHQGLQFFPDRLAAVRQMHRALAPGGRLAVATWRAEGEMPLIRELRGVAQRHVGPVTDRRHAFGEAGPLEALLRDAGLRDVRSDMVSRAIRFRDGAVFVRLNAMALVGMSAASRSMNEEDRERLVTAITQDSAETVRPYIGATGLEFELKSNVATARR